MSQENNYPPNQTACPLETGPQTQWAAVDRSLDGTPKATIVPPPGEEDADAPGRSNGRRYAQRNPAAGYRLRDFRNVVADPSGRAYANRRADIARLRKEKAMRQVHSSAAFTLAIILLGVPARPQSGWEPACERLVLCAPGCQ